VSDLAERAWKLLPPLLGAPGDDRAWLRFLEALCAELPGSACAAIATRGLRERPGAVLVAGVKVGRSGALGDEEPARQRLLFDGLAAGSVFSIPVDAEFITSRQVFQRLLAPEGVEPGPGLGVVLERNTRRATAVLLVLPKRGGWQPLPDDRALLERIAPHLVQARRLHAQLSYSTHDTEALLAVFDRLVLGVILIDREGRVSYANRSAAELLGEEPGLTDPATLAKKTDPRTDALGRFIGRERLTSHGALVFSHPKDDRPLQMFSTPLSWPVPEREARARFVRAVFIGDPSRTTGEPTEILRELYGLTQAESRLAILLATNHSLSEAASHLGIAVSTARTVLKTVFSKTGANRQAKLVRLLVVGPGQVRGPARRG